MVLAHLLLLETLTDEDLPDLCGCLDLHARAVLAMGGCHYHARSGWIRVWGRRNPSSMVASWLAGSVAVDAARRGLGLSAMRTGDANDCCLICY
ncbi:hypothetical protein ACLOJK_006630 [Asimina triloba]